jgi:hypothetical protein
MGDAKKIPWWRHSITITPGHATLPGLVVGLVAFPYFDRVSYILWLFLALTGGAWGHISWRTSDRARDQEFQRIATPVAFAAIAVLFSGAWSIDDQRGPA